MTILPESNIPEILTLDVNNDKFVITDVVLHP